MKLRRPAILCGAVFLCAGGALAQAKPKPSQAKPAAARAASQKIPPPRLAHFQSRARRPHPKAAAKPKPIQLTVPEGTPLRVSLLKRVPTNKVGVPVAARVVEPVYSFNRVVIPAGSKVTGKVIRIIPASKFRRAEAMMNGNFTPLRTAKVEFDTLVLENGTHIPIDTKVSPGIRDVIRLVTKQDKPVKPGLINQARHAVGQEWHSALHAARTLVSLHHWKKFAISQMPYHHQYLHRGTVFEAELVHPLHCGQETLAPGALADYGDPPPANSVVQARLLTTLSSATAHKGARVEALITKPLFSPHKKLLILPEGTKLEGSVVQVHPARRLHRNGLLRIVIRRMELPSGVTTPVDANLAGLAVSRSSHITLDAEGGASIPQRKRRYLDTALSLAIATSTFDSDAGRAAGRHGGDLTNRGLAGGSGFRLVGLIVGATVQSRALGQALGFYGAGWSVYDHFIARGHDVVLARNTPMTIAFGSQQPTGH
jgi:hypothetical protein